MSEKLTWEELRTLQDLHEDMERYVGWEGWCAEATITDVDRWATVLLTLLSARL